MPFLYKLLEFGYTENSIINSKNEYEKFIKLLKKLDEWGNLENIDYNPNKWLVESKSLKLYLQGYRNHGAFHEDCSISIAQDLIKVLKPSWLRIGAYWFPRGGIPIDIFWQTGPTPKNIYLPDQNIPVYKGRF